MNKIESLQIYRLIDGEISNDEIRQLSQVADQSPELWRKIGITLLEDRCWQNQIGTAFERLAAANPPANRLSDDDSISVFNSNAESTSAEITTLAMAPTDRIVSTPQTLTVPNQLASNVATKAATKAAANHDAIGLSEFRETKFAKLRWLLLAASLMLAVWMGYTIGQHDSPLSRVAERDRWEDYGSHWTEDQGEFRNDFTGLGAGLGTNNPPRGIRPAMLQPERHYDLPANSQSPLQGSVPLYSIDSVAQLQSLEEADSNRLVFSKEQIEKFGKQGIMVNQKMELIEGSLEDGRIFVVPIRTFHFSAGQ